jgi:glucose-6-phosphate isomerase, archaeal
VNTGDEPYAFLAVYPGGAGHDYGWVLEHGMGSRAYRATDGVELRPYTPPAAAPAAAPETAE